jgi:glucan phosphorylase
LVHGGQYTWRIWRAWAAMPFNGVAELHSELLTREVLQDFYEL